MILTRQHKRLVNSDPFERALYIHPPGSPWLLRYQSIEHDTVQGWFQRLLMVCEEFSDGIIPSPDLPIETRGVTGRRLCIYHTSQ